MPVPRVLPLLLLLAVSAVAAEPPSRLATEARLDVTSSDTVGALRDVRWVSGGGSLTGFNWTPHPERGVVAQFAVTRFAESPVAFTFTPERSGEVWLALRGPWEEASPGVLMKLESEWTSLQVEGATWSDAAWNALPRPVRTWHNAPQGFAVTVAAGRPVTIRASARAALPAGMSDMRRLPANTPAHRAARRFLRGVNFSNEFEAPPSQDWGARHDAVDVAAARRAGFDHLRVPAGWHHHRDANGRIRPEFFARVDAIVTNALAQGLAVLVNTHHFDEFTTDPAGQRAAFLDLWRQVAEHYASAPDHLAFEILNEPRDAATTEVMSDVYPEVIRVIRRSNPRRTLFVGPGKWNQTSELPRLRLPDDDDNLIVTLHQYHPMEFTHQGASWTGPDTQVTGVVYPGPPAQPLVVPEHLTLAPWVRDWFRRYNTLPAAQNPSGPSAFVPALKLARQWSDYYGRPVHYGEFGAYVKADPVSRARYCADFRRACEAEGMGWAMWDWSQGFRFWDRKTQAPAPGMAEALFGK